MPDKVQDSHTPQRVQKGNCTYTVLSLLQAGIQPSQIWAHHGISKRNVLYITRKLRDSGAIRKVGLGTWEVAGDAQAKIKGCKKVHRVTPRHTPPLGAKSDSIRGHGIQAVVQVPKDLPKWKERERVLIQARIPFEPIPQGQRIQVGEIEKVWLTNRSIVYYLPYSWYADTAGEASARIFEDMIEIILKTERYLGIRSLKIEGGYRVKFSRRHYSMIRNGLAKLYKDPARKLFVRDDGGLWLLIDNSYNLEELEHVRASRGQEDEVKNVQDFFNGLKKDPITPKFILDGLAQATQLIHDNAANMDYFGRNQVSHVKGIQDLAYQASENVKATHELRSVVHKLAETVSTLREARNAELRPSPGPQKTLGDVREERICSLCGAVGRIPRNRTRCDKCEEMLQPYKAENIKEKGEELD